MGLIRIRFLTLEAPRKIQGLLYQFSKQGVRDLVLDLRGCQGSNLETSVQVVDLFVPEGELVLQFEDRTGRIDSFESKGRPILQCPFVVLVNEETGVGGEILARALRSYRQAFLIGTATRGSSLVTEIFPLSNGYAVRIPSRRILPYPGGKDVSLSLKPDIDARVNPGTIRESYRASSLKQRLALDAGFKAAVEYLRK
jgi:carboxyl-terminal processing protease